MTYYHNWVADTKSVKEYISYTSNKKNINTSKYRQIHKRNTTSDEPSTYIWLYKNTQRSSARDVTPRFGPLANRIEMINFGMQIHNLLKYITNPQAPKPLKASKDRNLREPNE